MTRHHVALFSMLIVFVLCATTFPAAQPSTDQGRAALSGMWVLNRELSQAPPSPGEGGDTGRGRGRDGGFPGGGFPPPDGGGRGGFGGRGGVGGGPPGDFGGGGPDPEQMKKTRALMDELMAATPRLSIFQREEGRIAFVDADGHTRTFTTNGKKEKHQLQAGTVETSTKWEGVTLVQQSTLGGGVTVTQTFAIDDAKRLVVSTTLDDSRMGKVPPTKRVYDADGDR